MSRPSSPLADLVAGVSEQVSSAADAASSAASSAIAGASGSFDSLKSNLDTTVSQLSGGIGTGLNGFTAAAGDLANDARGALGGATGALGGISNTIQSLASNATGAFAGAAGALGGVAGGLSNAGAAIGASLNKLGLAGGGIGGGLASLATSVSSAAGMVNNLLSMARGKNLPTGAELFSKEGSFVKLESGSADDWRVKLNANFGLFGSAFGRLSKTGGFVWPYLPSITVSSKANYAQIDTVHSNQPFQAYKSSQIDDIQISGEFSVENELDAEYWIQGTTFLKTATRMFFGTGPNVGNPPIVCNLTGYGARVFAGVPVIVKSFSVDFKDDVAYIKHSLNGAPPTWVPAMSTISVTVSPIYNRTRLRQFNLTEYANGNIVAGQGFI
jgi:hypothetical protein